MSERALVSVVITNYNYGRFLAEAIESVLQQTYEPIEIIVVDDGSTDESRAILAGYSVKAIYQENAGQASALNRGVSACRGDVICLLDADDGWSPDKVERTVAAFAQHARCGWLRHNLRFVDAERNSLGLEIPGIRTSGLIPAASLAVRERVITASTSALALRARAAAEVFPLPDGRTFQFDADAVLVARLGARHAGWQCAESLGWYRRHDLQQFGSASDMRKLLERQVAVGRFVAADLAVPEPVSNYKHRAVLNVMEGRARSAEIMGGLRASLRLIPEPALMLRQMATLASVALAPRRWLEKHKRRQWSS